MRIAMITDYYLPTLGGVQTAIKAHKEALEAAGHHVVVYTPLTGPSADASVVRLPTATRFAPDGYPFAWSPVSTATWLTKHLRSHPVDVLHIHTEMFAALAGYTAARELGIPIVQSMHGRIDVYTRSVLPLPSLTTIPLAAMHRKHLGSAPAAIDPRQPYARTRMAQRMWRLMVTQANRAQRVIVPSLHFAQKLHAQGMTTPFRVISNGLEASVLARIETPQPHVREQDAPLRVMWCGRVSPEKRPQTFVDAVAQVEGIHAEMFGDGVARRRLARAARRLPNDRLYVRGPVPQDQVLAAMRTSDIFVSTSWDFDNQPMVILEALATGLPVVLCDPDLAEGLPSGAYVVTPTPDARGVAQVLTALRDDPDRCAALRASAHTHRDRVAQSAHLDALLEVYAEAMATRR